MQFDPENPVNKLCASGMEKEGEGKPDEAAQLFRQAWNEAQTVQEKFTAAHYVARHQASIADKLSWDKTALHYALETGNAEAQSVYPSLYLNIAKGFEDLGNFAGARENYQLALKYAEHLGDDGYGKLIRNGIQNGLERCPKHDVKDLFKLFLCKHDQLALRKLSPISAPVI